MKKIFAILLACAIIFSTLPVVVFAEAEAHDHAEVDQCHCDRDTRTGTLVRSVEANCTDVPYDVYQCDECGLEYTKTTGSALGHLDPTAQVVAPTCTEEGYTLYICQRTDCPLLGKETKTDIVPATGHDYSSVVTDPTCTEGGYTTYTCNVCGDTYVDNQVPANGHSYDDTVTAPDCDDAGYTTHVCSVCGDTYVDAPVDALGHDYKETARVEADCFVDGSITYTCEVCGDSYTEVIPAPMQHEYEVIKIPATCDEYGKLKHVCKLCNYGENGEVVIDDLTVPPLGHTEGDAVVENNVAPGCETDGSYDSVVYCAVCGDEISRETITVSAPGHDEEVILGYAKTCTTDGLTDGKKCTVCGTITLEQEIIPASHELVSVEAQEPTCSTLGWYAYDYCTVCDFSGYALAVRPAIPQNHHNVTTKAAQLPTCVADGWTEEIKCDLCGYIIASSKVVPSDTTKAEQHNVVSTVVDPTCTEKGYTEHVCQNGCGDVNFNYKDAWVDALGHTPGTPVEENRVEADCTVNGGFDTVVYCDVCDAELSRTHTVLYAPGHTLTYVDAKAPTCTEIGWNAYEFCSVCDYTTYVELPANGHNEGETFGIVEATCTTDGYTISICTVCGVQFQTHPETAFGHTEAAPVEENRVEATCTVNGSYDSVVYCATCGEELSRTSVELPAPGHTEAAPVEENRVEATCTVDGSYDTVVYCAVCGEELSRTSNVLTAPGHTLSYVDAKAPTCTEIGWNAYEFCSVCGYTTYVELPALGHTEEILPAVAPTFDTTGLTEGKKCAVCGEILVPQNVVNALNEFIKFSYKATGINGVANATNSGFITVEIWMEVTAEQARLWGIDLDVLFGEYVDLVSVGGCIFDTTVYTKIENANDANKVTVSQTMAMENSISKTFTKGEYKFATLTFKVDNNYYSNYANFDIENLLVVRDAVTDAKNDLVVTDGIIADKSEATIYVQMLGDANNDGVLNSNDSLSMSTWSTAEENKNNKDAYDTVYDLNKDGQIDGLDFILLGNAVVGNDDYLN